MRQGVVKLFESGWVGPTIDRFGKVPTYVHSITRANIFVVLVIVIVVLILIRPHSSL